VVRCRQILLQAVATYVASVCFEIASLTSPKPPVPIFLPSAYTSVNFVVWLFFSLRTDSARDGHRYTPGQTDLAPPTYCFRLRRCGGCASSSPCAHSYRNDSTPLPREWYKREALRCRPHSTNSLTRSVGMSRLEVLLCVISDARTTRRTTATSEI